MEQYLNSPWVVALLTVVGIILGSVVARQWAHRNGEELGRRVGRWLPGDQVERWLGEFLSGLQEGLAETYTPVVMAAQKVTDPKMTDLARFDIRLQPSPGADFPKSSGG